MSVTVESLLKLPSLRQATVLAGANSLDRIVTSVSVLEYANLTEMQRHLYENLEFSGSELVITGFCSIKDDVDAQCANIRKLAMVGEVGIILYYVGLLLPKVDQRLIDLSNELGFVLICMPENEPSLRYSEVICEAMEAIVQDQVSSTNFPIELLEQVARLPAHQRTMDTVLRIVSDRLRASAVIADAELHVLNAAAWPRKYAFPWEHALKSLPLPQAGGPPLEDTGEFPSFLYRDELHLEPRRHMNLFIQAEHSQLTSVMRRQTVEAVQIALNIWGKQHDRIELIDLVKAIIQDEPIKMRRLAEIYRIDISALHSMWILHGFRPSNFNRRVDEIRELSRPFANILMCERYEETLLIFPIGPDTLQESDAWARELVQYCARERIPAVLTRCLNLEDTAAVKNAFLTNQRYVTDAKIIFPHKTVFTFQDSEFAGECRRIIDSGEQAVADQLAVLEPVLSGRDAQEILKTLSTYFLDARLNITDTAALLFLHKNTIKYRLQKASDTFGFRVGDMPGSGVLFQAAALQRLIQGSKL